MTIPSPALILLVDDEKEILTAIGESLADLGHEVLYANDGLEALEIIKTRHPDTIMSDINMPRMNGLELIYEIRSQGIETPCVLLTAHFNHENMIQALRIGVTDFLEKPFKLKDLIHTIESAANLGKEIKRLDKELDEWCEKNEYTPEKRIAFKRSKLALMVMRTNPKPIFSKAS